MRGADSFSRPAPLAKSAQIPFSTASLIPEQEASEPRLVILSHVDRRKKRPITVRSTGRQKTLLRSGREVAGT
jgi:hypothetical protein